MGAVVVEDFSGMGGLNFSDKACAGEVVIKQTNT